MKSKSGLPKRAKLYWTTIVVAVTLVACKIQVMQDWPNEEIENNSSPLLGVLITKQDLSGEWLWSDTFTYQNIETPIPNNQHLIERAARSLTGYYGAEKIRFDLQHSLELYEQHSPPVGKLRLAEDLHLTNPTISQLSLPTMGRDTTSECVRDPAHARVACRVITKYDSITSIIDIYGPATVDNRVIEQILSHLLTTMDPRIPGIDIRQ